MLMRVWDRASASTSGVLLVIESGGAPEDRDSGGGGPNEGQTERACIYIYLGLWIYGSVLVLRTG